MDELVRALMAEGALWTPRIIEAFRSVDREDFVLPEYARSAYEDEALPIGYDQTISQPSTVAFMLELLGPQSGERILDVGSGSGWTTALLASAVGDAGSVVGVERIPALVAFGSKNLAKYPFRNVRAVAAGATLGFPDSAPYDRILVSAEATEVPRELVEQLRDGGTMVIPVGNAVVRVKKIGAEIATERHEGFAFVPLIEEPAAP